ncbi:MAG: hypothetical protein CSB33_00135, partial [Desulfobacterales bacterium]
FAFPFYGKFNFKFIKNNMLPNSTARSSQEFNGGLISLWGAFVLSQNECLFYDGRVVLPGDHTQQPKDGGRMPGDEESGKAKKKLGTNIVQMALDFAFDNCQPCVLVLDAFFPSADVFRRAYSYWSVRHKAPFVTLIVRAKKNCVAWFEAETSTFAKPGRPHKYGEKVKLMALFDHKVLSGKSPARSAERPKRFLFAVETSCGNQPDRFWTKALPRRIPESR